MSSNRPGGNLSSRSIVPPGFELTAHPIFLNYSPTVVDVRKSMRDVSNLYHQLPDTLTLGLPPKASETALPVSGISAGKTSASHTDCNSIKEVSCSICISLLVDPVTLAPCKHNFCFDCIMHWFKVHQSCPICKLRGEFLIRSVSTGVITSSSKVDYNASYKVFKVSSSEYNSDSRYSNIITQFDKESVHQAIRQHLNLMKQLSKTTTPPIAKAIDPDVFDNKFSSDSTTDLKFKKRLRTDS